MNFHLQSNNNNQEPPPVPKRGVSNNNTNYYNTNKKSSLSKVRVTKNFYNCNDKTYNSVLNRPIKPSTQQGSRRFNLATSDCNRNSKGGLRIKIIEMNKDKSMDNEVKIEDKANEVEVNNDSPRDSEVEDVDVVRQEACVIMNTEQFKTENSIFLE